MRVGLGVLVSLGVFVGVRGIGVSVFRGVEVAIEVGVGTGVFVTVGGWVAVDVGGNVTEGVDDFVGGSGAVAVTEGKGVTVAGCPGVLVGVWVLVADGSG